MNFARSFLIAALVVFSGFGIFAQTPVAVAQPPDSETARLRLETFEKVWSTVNDNHYDPTFGGVNWNKVREDYLPRAIAARSETEFNGVLREMLGELKLSHFGIFPKNLAAIAAGGEAGRHLAAIATPLIIHDLPVTVWWPGEPSLARPETIDLLSGADRLVVDGSSWSGD